MDYLAIHYSPFADFSYTLQYPSLIPSYFVPSSFFHYKVFQNESANLNTIDANNKKIEKLNGLSCIQNSK
ncbi:hypothetical protein ACFDTO_19580 [Microbacteriaceae bacterium 4G12]